MSTRFFLTLAAVTAPAALAAQRTVRPASAAPRIGTMAGVNSTTFGGADAEEADHRTGFVGGLYLTIPIGSPLVAFRPEVLFAQKGAQDEAEGVTGDVRLGYLEVPLLLQVAIPTGDRVRPRVYAGPSLAFETSCRIQATAGSGFVVDNRMTLDRISAQSTTTFTSGCTDTGNDIDLGVKSFDLGGVVGAQVNFDLGGRAVGVGARYTYGFNSITKYGSLKNRAISVYGSLELPFGR